MLNVAQVLIINNSGCDPQAPSICAATLMTMHTIVTVIAAALIDFTNAAKRNQVGVAPVERR